MRRLALVVALATALVGCGGSPTGDEPARVLRVFAAASLTEAFTELAGAFEDDHPGVDVELTFAGSSALAQQVLDGASADVFASADEANLAKVGEAAVDPQVFARNRLAIVVEPGNPKGIGGLADLAAPGLAVVVCAPEVPCGRLAAAALRSAGVELQPASLEENVKGVLAKVTLGEADAGLVYVTDAQAAADEADTIPLDDLGPGLDTAYPISVLADAADAELASDFVAFVRSAAAQRTLRSFGFLAP